jgi:hypothetical protein
LAHAAGFRRAAEMLFARERDDEFKLVQHGLGSMPVFKRKLARRRESREGLENRLIGSADCAIRIRNEPNAVIRGFQSVA